MTADDAPMASAKRGSAILFFSLVSILHCNVSNCVGLPGNEEWVCHCFWIGLDWFGLRRGLD